MIWYPAAALAQTLDEYIAGHKQITDHCRRTGGDAGRQVHNEDRAPPLDAVACAALPATADRLLALDSPRALSGHERHLLSHDERRPGKADWTRRFLICAAPPPCTCARWPSAARSAKPYWCIDADTWAHLVAQLPDSPWPHRREPELGDRKRQCASIIVWTPDHQRRAPVRPAPDPGPATRPTP